MAKVWFNPLASRGVWSAGRGEQLMARACSGGSRRCCGQEAFRTVGRVGPAEEAAALCLPLQSLESMWSYRDLQKGQLPSV